MVVKLATFPLQNSQSSAFYSGREPLFLPCLSSPGLMNFCSEFITRLNCFIVYIVPDLASRSPSKLAPVFSWLFSSSFGNISSLYGIIRCSGPVLYLLCSNSAVIFLRSSTSFWWGMVLEIKIRKKKRKRNQDSDDTHVFASWLLQSEPGSLCIHMHTNMHLHTNS